MDPPPEPKERSNMSPLNHKAVDRRSYLTRGQSSLDEEDDEEMAERRRSSRSERSCRPGYAWKVMVRTVRGWVGLQTEEEELEAARQRSRGSGRPFGAVLMRGEGAESALEAAEDDGTLPRPGGVVAQPVSARVNLLAKKYLW